MWLTFCKFRSSLTVEFHPVYNPSVEEQNNPKLFAENVRKYMADALKVCSKQAILVFLNSMHYQRGKLVVLQPYNNVVLYYSKVITFETDAMIVQLIPHDI